MMQPKFEVKNGIDNITDYKRFFYNKRLGLVTNMGSFDKSMRFTGDIIRAEFDLRVLFAPEHGLNGSKQAGEDVGFTYDTHTGLPVYSLYGEDTHIPEKVMEGLDCIIFDIQDVGVRYYTYLSLLLSIMEDCRRYNRELVVFDRVNPLGGMAVEGNFPDILSEVCALNIPNRYGLTIGEIAGLANSKIGCSLHVVPLSGWRRSMLFEDTDLLWINPSPNLPSPVSAFIYVGTCLFEGTNISEGRGTTRPFETIGAPWLEPYELADAMNALHLDGAAFSPVWFTPACSKHSGELCGGVRLHVTDRQSIKPLGIGLQLLLAIKECSIGRFGWIQSPNIGERSFIDYLAGTASLRETTDVKALYNTWEKDATGFAKAREQFMLYD